MEDNRKLCLFVSYYLSRFNLDAYNNLGYSSMLEGHEDIGRLLNVNPHTVKNMRDQFDPLHGFRVGWYQEPLSPSRARVVQALENLEESEIRGIVKDILSGKINEEPEQISQLLLIADDERKQQKKFILRGPTGKAAEICFIEYHKANSLPVSGELIDCRDLGCGYDFKIKSENKEIFIEVKGLAEITGGILLTDKEWNTAQKHGEDYILCLVKNISVTPEISFITNPGSKLNPNKNIYTVVQINWSVGHKELLEIS
jgi:hypothetical protein